MDRRLKSYCILFVLILFTAVILSGCLSGRTSLEVPDANETLAEETNVQLRMLTTMAVSYTHLRAKPFRHGRQRQDSEEMGGGRTKAKQSSTAAATSLPPQRAHGHFAGPGRKVS